MYLIIDFVLQCLMACFYSLSGNALRMIEYLGFLSILISLVGVHIMLYLRYKQPDLPRPFKVLNSYLSVISVSILHKLVFNYNCTRYILTGSHGDSSHQFHLFIFSDNTWTLSESQTIRRGSSYYYFWDSGLLDMCLLETKTRSI